MPAALARLSREQPLPAGWSEPQLFADTIRVGALEVRRAGIVARAPDGAEVTGSAAQTQGSPLPRAWYELLERAAVLDAAERACPVRDPKERVVGEVARGVEPPGEPSRRRASRSNGVALHRSWAAACERARLELLERDRVLRSWHGELPLRETPAPAWLDATEAHEWRAALVPPRKGERRPTDAVAVVIGFPRRAEVPLARGFAARPSRDAALEAAAAEALQSLAFLWDEPVPERSPELAPTPLFHLDYYLCPDNHEPLRRWLAGAHPRLEAPGDGAADGALRFVDLTPADAAEGLRVARAVDEAARELVFGAPPEALAERLPSALHVHPIP